jgi:acyl-CoA reductase-like NAD-dependent aldehyde dehydrogenase
MHRGDQTAEQMPLSRLRLGELVQEAGIPWAVNIVPGYGETRALPWRASGRDKIAFTGRRKWQTDSSSRCRKPQKVSLNWAASHQTLF